jgi:hypothetical protein
MAFQNKIDALGQLQSMNEWQTYHKGNYHMSILSFLHVSGPMVVTHSYIWGVLWVYDHFQPWTQCFSTSGATFTITERCRTPINSAVMDHTAYLLLAELNCAHHMGMGMPGWDWQAPCSYSGHLATDGSSCNFTW